LGRFFEKKRKKSREPDFTHFGYKLAQVFKNQSPQSQAKSMPKDLEKKREKEMESMEMRDCISLIADP